MKDRVERAGDSGYDAGRRAFQRGDYAAALAALQPLAEDGHIKALYTLSLMYADGLGVKRDEKEALGWLHMAVDAGLQQAHIDLGASCTHKHEVLTAGTVELESIHIAAGAESRDAQVELAFKLARGQDVPRNDQEALRWFRRAADNGSREAQAALGFMYADGRAVPQDDTIAASWFRRAADHGLSTAQLALGFLYSVGRGVPRDDLQAYMWFSVSEDNEAGDHCRQKEVIAARMTAEQIARAENLARKWRSRT